MRIALVILACTGCSWVGVSAPVSPGRPGNCTTSPVLPAIDGVVAAAALGFGTAEAVWYARNPGAEFRSIDETAAAILLGTGVVYALAAWTGGSEVAACREATATPTYKAALIRSP